MITHAVLDCVDGEVARGCNKKSKLGSRLDTLNDFIYIGLVLAFIAKKHCGYKFNLKTVGIAFVLNTLYNIFVNKFDFDSHEMKDQFALFLHDNSVMVSVITFVIMCM